MFQQNILSVEKTKTNAAGNQRNSKEDSGVFLPALKWICHVVDLSLLVCLSLYIFCKAAVETTLFLPNLSNAIDIIRLVTEAIVFAGSPLRLFYYWRSAKKQKFITLLISIGIFALLAVISRQNGFSFLFMIGLFLPACAGIRDQRIWKAYLLANGCLLFFTLFSALSGFVVNLVHTGTDFIRSSWGIAYPTDMASSVLFFVLFFWLAFGDKIPDLVMLIPAVESLCNAYFIAHSLTSSICSILLIIFLFLHTLIQSLRRPDRLLKFGGRCLLAEFPVFSLFTFFLIRAYLKGSSFAMKADGIFHSRVSLMAQAYQNYGLHIFGAPLPQDGNGFSTIPGTVYNFVDNSYALMLLRYGWLFFILVTFLWEYLLYRAVQTHQRRLALVMGIIAVHALSEHHFPDINYNILLVMAFSAFPKKGDKGDDFLVQCRKIGKFLVRHWLALLSTVLIIALIPLVLSWNRVLGLRLGMIGGGRMEYKAMIVLAVELAFASFLVWSLDHLWNVRKVTRKRRRSIRQFFLFVGLIIAMTLSANLLIDQQVERDRILIESDRNAMKVLTENASGPIYVQGRSEEYRRVYGSKIHSSVFDGDDLARCKNITVLVNYDDDSACFINQGFLFTVVSSGHALYTNDESAIQALEGAGYLLTNYYSAERSVDLSAMAAACRLPFDQNGVTMTGPDQALNAGWATDLRGGNYTAVFHLKSECTSRSDQDQVCEIGIYNGGIAANQADQTIMASQFDENGEAVIEIPFSTAGIRSASFFVLSRSDYKLNVKSISWKKVP